MNEMSCNLQGQSIWFLGDFSALKVFLPSQSEMVRVQLFVLGPSVVMDYGHAASFRGVGSAK